MYMTLILELVHHWIIVRNLNTAVPHDLQILFTDILKNPAYLSNSLYNLPVIMMFI